jgi:hypothetical protein
MLVCNPMSLELLFVFNNLTFVKSRFLDGKVKNLRSRLAQMTGIGHGSAVPLPVHVKF